MPGSQRFSLVGHCAVPFPSRFDPSIYVLRSSLIPLGEKFPVERLNHGFFDGSWVGQSPFLIFLRSQSPASAPSPGHVELHDVNAPRQAVLQMRQRPEDPEDPEGTGKCGRPWGFEHQTWWDFHGILTSQKLRSDHHMRIFTQNKWRRSNQQSQSMMISWDMIGWIINWLCPKWRIWQASFSIQLSETWISPRS